MGEELPFSKQVSEFTTDDRRHPYWAFLNAMKLHEITVYDDENDPEVIAARARFARERRIERYRKADADDAFRRADYASFVSILEEFDDLLTQGRDASSAFSDQFGSVRGRANRAHPFPQLGLEPILRLASVKQRLNE